MKYVLLVMFIFFCIDLVWKCKVCNIIRNFIKFFKYWFLYKYIIIDLYKNKKAYCNYCKYSVSVNGELYCLKKGRKSKTYRDIVIEPVECRLFNRYNKCDEFKFSIFYFIKNIK